MIRSSDQLGNEIILEKIPEKIISLVPSVSELLWDLGLQKELAGITKFCIHPDEMFHSKKRIGGTKNIDIGAIQSIAPDLIIGNKEENTREDIEKLSVDFPVWMSDVNTVEDALQMISEIGRICRRETASAELIKTFRQRRKKNTAQLKIIYLIWNEPIYAAGKNTFIDAMISEAGFENLILKSRYPEITTEDIRHLNPDYLFLSTEPYPFKEKHFDYFEKCLPREKIILVDGESFSWYGSHMIKALHYFDSLRNDLNNRR